MCHGDAFCHTELDDLVSLGNCFVDRADIDPAGIVGELFEGRELELDTEGNVFHFECAGDLLVGDEGVEHAGGAEEHVAIAIGGFELVITEWFSFHGEDFCAHPLSEDIRVGVCFEKQFNGEVEIACHGDDLGAFFGADFCFLFHGGLFIWFVFFHDAFQLIKAVVPHFAEGFDEFCYFFHFFSVDVIVYLAPGLLRLEELAFG